MTTGEIAEFLGAELIGGADVEIVRLASYNTAQARGNRVS